MSAPASKAVFLSYASQDASAARAICEALRHAGVEVWFDQNELVGGDVWDAKFRRQIAAWLRQRKLHQATPVLVPRTTSRRSHVPRLHPSRLAADLPIDFTDPSLSEFRAR